MKILILIVAFTFSASAAVYQTVSGESDFRSAPEYQALLNQIKLQGGFEQKESNPPTKVEPAQMTRGKMLVEEAKARNRAAIAKRRNEDKEREDTNSKLSTLDQWKAEVKETNQAWLKEIQDQRLQWKKEQDIFLGRVKVYQEATYVIPAKPEKIVEKKVPTERVPEAFIVSDAFKVPIRDQQGRATCASFAGVRAIEILLAQNKLDKDLSEQYLYWASKPTCQKSPCSQKGSWVTRGYDFSKSQERYDIPLENSCPYEVRPVSTNETQVPLPQSCAQGVAQVLDYARARTLAEVVETIKKNIPVVMSASLTTNFYFNEGLITFEESKKNSKSKNDIHSQGHAFLVVGVMELPEKIKSTEGNYCLVVANSWGRGWGAGGYGCLTEKWITTYRSDNTFVGPTKVSFL